MAEINETNIIPVKNIKIMLSETQTENFKRNVKIGILKQLHKKRLLTYEQIQSLTLTVANK